METPTVNTLWGQVIVDELVKAGITAVVIAPGSRSTPLTVACVDHDGIDPVALLDERSAAFYALGRAKRTGVPTPIVCTSGTAAANFHPAVIEAHHARVPMVVLTADRPPELQTSGANQTIDQHDLYGSAVRQARTLPEPEAADRKLRSLRTTVARAAATATGTPPGPIHLNIPFRKPLAPTTPTAETPPSGVPAGDLPPDFQAAHRDVVDGRDGPWVETTRGHHTLSSELIADVSEALATAGRGLIVCGPTNQPRPSRDALVALATATGFPVVADPLSGHRFGPAVSTDDVVLCGGYDSYLAGIDATPDVVIRFGASPTSKTLRQYLRDADARQFLVDPAGDWREATFTATDLLAVDATPLARALADSIDRPAGEFTDSLQTAEATYWSLVTDAEPLEAGVVADTVALAPTPATVVVSNSMPVRDLDRFGQPNPHALTVLGNRGASGIDGVTATAFGAGAGAHPDDAVILITGDIAFLHDLNGLLAANTPGAEATIVCLNNDGGGIFEQLPIADHSAFDDWFRMPHGLDFAHAAELYEVSFARTSDRSEFQSLYRDAVGQPGTHVIEVETESSRMQRDRQALQARVTSEVSGLYS